MNKQQLNNAFESFNPTEQQKQRMFDGIMAKKNNVFSWRKVYIPACSVAAAALIFAVTSGLLAPSGVTDNGNLVAVSNSDVTQQVQNDSQKTQTDDTTATTAKKETTAEMKYSAKQQEKSVADTNQAENNVADTKQSEITDMAKPENENKSPANQAAAPEIIPGEVMSVALNINTASVALKSRAASEPVVAAADTTESVVAYDGEAEQGAPVGGGGGASSGGGSAAAGYDITYDKFCSEIGSDIRNALKVPEGMSDITVQQKHITRGAPVDWDVSYVGADGCFVTVNICTDTQHNRQYFETGSFEKTDVNGIDAVVIYDGSSYTAYIDINNVSYTVITNISEQQLSELLASMI